MAPYVSENLKWNWGYFYTTGLFINAPIQMQYILILKE